MAGQPPIIVSAGVVCSVGLNVPAMSAAVRASIHNFVETQYFASVGEPLLGAAIPSDTLWPEETEGWCRGGEEKLLQMFMHSSTECIDGAGGFDPARTSLMLLGPESTRPSYSAEGMARRLARCQETLGMTFHPSSRVFHSGSPGLVEALGEAQTLLLSGGVDGVLVAGVDSFLNPGDIHAALLHGRLLTSDNSDGFVPGEAAACVFVKRMPREAPRTPVLAVAGLGMAQETQILAASMPSRGVGLSRAINEALHAARLPAHAMHARYADVSAEAYFFEDASYGWTRVLRGPSPQGYTYVVPATIVGHVGAAAGPMMLAIALDAARKGRAAGPNSLMHFACSGSARAALVVAAS